MGGERTDHRWFKVLNIEQQNKEPQNDEVITFDVRNSLFDILRFKEAVAQMKSILIAFLLNSGFCLLSPCSMPNDSEAK